MLTNGRDGEPHVATEGAVKQGLEVNGTTDLGKKKGNRHGREEQETRQGLQEAHLLQLLVGPAQRAAALLLAAVVELLHKPEKKSELEESVWCVPIKGNFKFSQLCNLVDFLGQILGVTETKIRYLDIK